MKLFIIALLFPLWVHSASLPPEVNELELQQRFSQKIKNDGPNCFNTAFLALNYLKDVVHTSTFAGKFYLKNFCEEISVLPAKASSGALIAYHNANSDLVHVAVALGNGRVFEKYTYMGSHRTTRRDSARSGEYIFQSLEQSYYFKNYSAKKTKVYHCVDALQMQQVLQPLEQLSHVQSLLQLTEKMSAEILTVEPEQLDQFFQGTAVTTINELKTLLRVLPTSKLEQNYVRALVTSLRDQLELMAEGAPISCEKCGKRSLAPLRDQLGLIDQLLAKNYSANL